MTTSSLAAKSVENSKIEFVGVNYQRLSVYLTLVLGRTALIKHGISEAVAERANESEAESLACKTNRDLSGWLIENKEFQWDTQRKMLALFVQILTTIMMSSHCYSFGGKIYIQCIGAGIGLRASACLARIIMCTWDTLWAKYQTEAGIVALLFVRYVDDLRLYTFPINDGWTWTDKGWKYC